MMIGFVFAPIHKSEWGRNGKKLNALPNRVNN